MGTVIIAGKGSGKSRLIGYILAWIYWAQGNPVVLIDPMGQAIAFFVHISVFPKLQKFL